jgi:hypothetical protein
MKLLLALVIASGVSGCISAPTAASCAISGEAVQWQADYCLFAAGTDDLVAAQPCMDLEAKVNFPNDCTEKQYYKKHLCTLAIDSGSRPGPVEQCMQDTQFYGPTVRNGGAQ